MVGAWIGGVVMSLVGAGLIVLGVMVPVARTGLWGAGIPILAVSPLFWLLPRLLGGGGARLRKHGGLPGTARVLGVRDTGVTINDLTAIFRITAEVTVPGRAPYEAQFRLPVPRTQWGAIQPGVTLPVLVDPRDPRKVAYDDQRVDGPATPAAASAAPAFAATMSARDIVTRGQHGTATVTAAQLTGRTAGELSPAAGLRPDEADDPVAIVQLQVEPGNGLAPFAATSGMRVPDGKSSLLAPGTRVPIAFLPENPAATVTIDWERA